MKLIFATNNKHKVAEIKSFVGNRFEILSLKEAGIEIDIPEPYNTLEENATEKSKTIYKLTGTNCFGEDTGLEVEALHGEPGVKSARYAGEGCSFKDNMDKLLKKLGDNPNRKARFRAVISLLLDGEEKQFEGICEGKILAYKKGEDGFGYDPIFIPDGANRSFAEMTITEKNKYNHRAKAAAKLVAFLQTPENKHQLLNSSSNHNTSETDLIRGCIAGNRVMQEELYKRFSPKMYAVCLRYAGNADDAQDILQDGFIKIYKNLPRFRSEGSFEGWIRRIFVNTAIEHLRRKTYLKPIAEKEENTIPYKAITVLDSLGEKDIMNLISQLSPGYRTVFNMYVVEGYTHKEVGDILGISEGTSKSQLARARMILQDRVVKFLDEKDRKNKPL